MYINSFKCYAILLHKINAYQVLTLPPSPSFPYTRENNNTTNYMVITVISLSFQVLAHQQKLSAILSSCVHLCFLICVLFFFFFSPFGGMFIFQSLYLGIIIKPYSFFFLSHIQAVHPKHFKILLFLPVLVLKSCHFLSVPEAKKPHPNIFIYSNMFSSSAQNVFCD